VNAPVDSTLNERNYTKVCMNVSRTCQVHVRHLSSAKDAWEALRMAVSSTWCHKKTGDQEETVPHPVC